MTTNTMVAIQTQTLGTAASSVTFNSIPQTYTDLMIVANTQATSGTSVYYGLSFNGDTTAHYSRTYLYGTGSSALSARQTGETVAYAMPGYVNPSNPVTITSHIMNYSNATTYKTILQKFNDASQQTTATVNLWPVTSAITSVSIGIGVGSGTFAVGSTFTLYGIANADIGAYATGGIITQDSTYYYHAFGSSGTFTPSRALTADILVVAGGGGGTQGGGGAGGVLANAAVSLASGTGYTCTVGAGGVGGLYATSAGASGSNSNVTGGSLSLTAAVGGGAGAAFTGNPNASATGGSGGGGSGSGAYIASNGTSGQGNAGGNGLNSGAYGGGGGGGGAGTGGAVATVSGTDVTGGNGGSGVTTVTNWGALAALVQATGYGVNGAIGGGGAGGGYNAGLGGTATAGGGIGYNNTTGGGSGVAGTGGGGGGNWNAGGTGAHGGTGGSGVIIIRYSK